MEAQALLENLRSRGFMVSADGDGLFVKPKAALTPADRTAIRNNKPELIKLIGAQNESSVTSDPAEKLLLAKCTAEGIKPEMDQYGIKLAPKMSGDLYIGVANYRRGAFERMKKHSAMVEE